MPRGAQKPRRRVRLDNDERRAQLLGLARKAFADRSYDDVSIDDLAGEARISKGLLYHYFPTKRDLYVAALREIADEMVANVTVIRKDLAPLDRIKIGLEAFLDHVHNQSRAFVALMRGGIGSDPEVAEVIESVRARLFESFLVDSPVKELFDRNARFEIMLKGWIGFVEAASIDWCANPRLTRDEMRDLLASVLFTILASPQARRSP